MNTNKFLNLKFLIITIVTLFVTAIIILILLPGRLVVETTPTDSKIFINYNEYKPFSTIRLKKDKYQINIQRENYIGETRDVEISPFKKIVLQVTLIPSNTFYEYPDLEILGKFPIEEDHFRIIYVPDINTITIVPKIPFDSTNPPEYFLETYWQDYEKYAKEALDWMNKNGLTKEILIKNKIKSEWWGQELWPEGATEPKI